MKYPGIVLLIVILFLSGLFYNNHITDNSNNVFRLNQSENIFQKDSLKIMTYNIQHGVGMDNKLNLNRTAGVINSVNPGIIGLNEVDNRLYRSNFKNQMKILSMKLGMNYVSGPNLKSITGNYGNGILSKYPVKKINNHELPTRNGREPRGLLETEVLIPPSFNLKVFVTHLSLEKEDRVKQWEWILNYINDLEEPFILMGDFNFEQNYTNNSNYLLASAETFPSTEPVQKIDMFFSNSLVEKKSYVVDSQASDHLPLVVEVGVNKFAKEL
ncbi:MAG: endonuclease/exonuclease/phosphatase family protein [Halanaerobiaceae bacterium]